MTTRRERAEALLREIAYTEISLSHDTLERIERALEAERREALEEAAGVIARQFTRADVPFYEGTPLVSPEIGSVLRTLGALATPEHPDAAPRAEDET